MERSRREKRREGGHHAALRQARPRAYAEADTGRPNWGALVSAVCMSILADLSQPQKLGKRV